MQKKSKNDLVIMNNKSCEYYQEILDLKEKLLSAEKNRQSGEKTYTIEEVNEVIKDLINK